MDRARIAGQTEEGIGTQQLDSRRCTERLVYTFTIGSAHPQTTNSWMTGYSSLTFSDSGFGAEADELQNFNFQIYEFFAQPAESVRCN
jgi:hypothetical protein